MVEPGNGKKTIAAAPSSASNVSSTTKPSRRSRRRFSYRRRRPTLVRILGSRDVTAVATAAIWSTIDLAVRRFSYRRYDDAMTLTAANGSGWTGRTDSFTSASNCCSSDGTYSQGLRRYEHRVRAFKPCATPWTLASRRSRHGSTSPGGCRFIRTDDVDGSPTGAGFSSWWCSIRNVRLLLRGRSVRP